MSEWSYNRSRCRKPRGALIQIWADLITHGLDPAQDVVSQYLNGSLKDLQ